MADISKLTLPNGDSYDFKVYTDHIAPMMSKTFTGVIGTANNFANASFYFGKVVPVNSDGDPDSTIIWKIKFSYYSYTDDQSLAKGYYEVFVCGTADKLISTDAWNNQKSTTYRPIYNTVVYRATQAGVEGQYGHLLGWQLYSSWHPTTAASARTFDVSIIECVNCTFEFFDTPLKYANVPGTGETNYDGYTEINGTTDGRVRTGQDNNDRNYYLRRYYLANQVVDSTPRYQILFTKNFDGIYLQGLTSDSNNVGTDKTLTTKYFNPFGPIYYYNSTTILAAHGVPAAGSLYRQHEVDVRYTFNTGSTLVAGKPFYVVCSPLADGTAVLHSDPTTQEIPKEENGLIYILLGYAYNDSNIEMEVYHPVYQYVNGRVQLYTVDAKTVNGYIPVNKAGDTMTGNLVVPAIRAANTYYGVCFGKTTARPKQTLLHTGIKWVSGKHIPVIHITGYAYGLQSPVEFKIGFYIYNGNIGYCGVVNMGSWAPTVYLIKHAVDDVSYVSVGLDGECYFLQLSVDVQDEMGNFAYFDFSSGLWSIEFFTTTDNIPEPDSGVTCIEVPYKADILNPKKVNGHTVNADVPSSAKFTDTTYSAGSNITLTGTTFSLTKANVVGALGYTPPEQDTTYDVATTSSNGLISAADKTKLDNLGIMYDASTETVSMSLGSGTIILEQDETTGNLDISCSLSSGRSVPINNQDENTGNLDIS